MSELSHSPAEVISQLLIDLGLASDPEETGTGTVSDFPIYISFMPDTPDDILVAYNTAGTVISREMVEGATVDRYGVQIKCRSEITEYNLGYLQLASIAEAASKDVRRYAVTVGSSVYNVQNLRKSSTVLSLGKESPESRRNLFSLNFLATIEEL